jgi:hypothetical protein
MRVLVILVALQCAGTAFLLWRSLATGAAPTVAQSAPMPAPAASAWPPVPSGPTSDERLRQIIREELAQLGSGGAAVPATPRDAEADRAQREQVAGQIAHYRSVGRITEAQMFALQRDIARLDPAGRRDMMAELTRAMNAREIQGLM